MDTTGADAVRDEPTVAQLLLGWRHADRHEAAALRRLHPRRPIKPPSAVPFPAVDTWKPIEYRGPNGYGERRWRCTNHPDLRQKCVANSVWKGREALQGTIRRHMARFHAERDAEVEARRAP